MEQTGAGTGRLFFAEWPQIASFLLNQQASPAVKAAVNAFLDYHFGK